MTSEELFKQDDFNVQYELARQTGDKRFGSECKHEQTKNGRCLKCLRKVIDRPVAGQEIGTLKYGYYEWLHGLPPMPAPPDAEE